MVWYRAPIFVVHLVLKVDMCEFLRSLESRLVRLPPGLVGLDVWVGNPTWATSYPVPPNRTSIKGLISPLHRIWDVLKGSGGVLVPRSLPTPLEGCKNNPKFWTPILPWCRF